MSVEMSRGFGSVYATQAELVDDELEMIRAWIGAAISRRQGAGNAPPGDLDHGELEISRRASAARASGVSLPILWLRERLGLTASELRVLWVLLAHELDATARGMLRQLNTENCADPTTDTIRAAAYGPTRAPAMVRELAADAPLRRLGLIERTDTDAHAPDHRQTWKITRRLVSLAYGELSLDPELAGIAAIVPQDTSLRGIGRHALEADASTVSRLGCALDALRRAGSGLLVVYGQRGQGRRLLLHTLAAERDLAVMDICLAALPANVASARRLLAIVSRECRLFGAIPLLRDLDALVASAPSSDVNREASEQPDRISLIERELGGQLTLATSAVPIARRWIRPPRTVVLPRLRGAERARLWARALPMATPQDAEVLTTMYPIAPALIDAAAAIAIEQSGAGKVTPEHIRGGLRAVLDDRLAGLATRVDITQSWDDLVLPPEQGHAMFELIARVRERRTVYETWGFGAKVGRGLGVSALFSGPPGTGKTMAAGLVARELGTELYQVDLSKIVSKWIGETEKNLAALFDAAEAGHAILLFDEADSLFGKRTDVRSSNDRYANQETNYLLQRLETFEGVCVLTTNHETAIDDAFRRRLAVHVQFPMPDLEEREQLWHSLLPSAAPVRGPLGLDELARRYEMSGGYIRNAVLRAAFLAANEESSITGDHLARAAELEYQTMGRIAASAL